MHQQKPWAKFRFINTSSTLASIKFVLKRLFFNLAHVAGKKRQN